MFRLDQIVTATTFIRSFPQISKHLAEQLEPLLVTQRNGRFLVVMDGEAFEGLLLAGERIERCSNHTESSAPYDSKP